MRVLAKYVFFLWTSFCGNQLKQARRHWFTLILILLKMIKISAAPKRFVAALNHTRCWFNRSKNVAVRSSTSFGRHPDEKIVVPGAFSTKVAVGSLDIENVLRDPVHVIPSEKKTVTAKASPKLKLTGVREHAWWTGPSPSSCPGTSKEGFLRSLPQLSLKNPTRESILSYFQNTWWCEFTQSVYLLHS